MDSCLENGLMGEGSLLILRRDFARSDSHGDMTYKFNGLVDVVIPAAYSRHGQSARAGAERKYPLKNTFVSSTFILIRILKQCLISTNSRERLGIIVESMNVLYVNIK